MRRKFLAIFFLDRVRNFVGSNCLCLFRAIETNGWNVVVGRTRNLSVGTTTVAGHTRLRRSTAAEREEKKKSEKRERRELMEEEVDRSVWVKYTLGLKHQVSKTLNPCSNKFARRGNLGRLAP